MFCINYFAAWPGKMSDYEFFDGADDGDGLPIRYTIPADEVKNISQLQKMVTIEIDRSRSRSNHLNKMMSNLIQKQKDVRKHTMESFKMLSEEIEKQEQRYYSLKSSPTGSDETTPPDPTTISDGLADPAQPLVSYRQNDTGDEGPAPPPPPRDSPPLYEFESSDEDSEQQPADLQPVIVSSSNPDQTDDPKIVSDTRDRVAGALRERGIPEDLKVNFEFHPIHGRHLLVTRQTASRERRSSACRTICSSWRPDLHKYWDFQKLFHTLRRLRGMLSVNPAKANAARRKRSDVVCGMVIRALMCFNALYVFVCSFFCVTVACQYSLAG